MPRVGQRLLLLRLALVAAASLLALFVAELALRALAWQADRQSFAHAFATGLPMPEPGEPIALAHLIRRSANPNRIYELRPNLDLQFSGTSVRTDDSGCRIIGRAPEGATRTLVGIGDSVMFGWGVEGAESYLGRLQEMLRERDGGWRVVNTGVPGYNSAMEVATFEEIGIGYRPDVVLINFVANDYDLPNFIRSDSEVLSVARSFLLDRLRGFGRVAAAGPARALPNGLAQLGFRNGRTDADPSQLPQRYREMVGVAGVERALRRLAALARRQHFEVRVLFTGFWPLDGTDYGPVTRIAGELGFRVIDLPAVFRERIEQIGEVPGPKGWRAAGLAVSAADLHPSPLAHAIAAEVVLRDLTGPQ
jgi:GDSL-like Lipase/Acylhydrolase family